MLPEKMGHEGEVMSSVAEINLTAGETLYREGDADDFAYVVERGEIILYQERDGVRTDIEVRGAGAVVGELSVLSGHPRRVTAAARTACKVYCISSSSIRSRFERLDPILRACIDTSIDFIEMLAKQISNSAHDIRVGKNALREPDTLIEQFRLETDMAKGLATQQFSMVFQPILAFPHHNICGFEALMRWDHPQIGRVPPDQFIKVAEKMGSIKPLTEFAITESCAAFARFRALTGCPPDLFASINISGQDIGRPDFVTFLEFALEANDLDPSHIQLELTETALISDLAVADKNFARLRALGCGIAIDDFGTGFSNFAQLGRLPITSLKIDKSFTQDALDSSVSRSIVKLMIGLGNDLGVDVIAEGLETAEGVALLQQMGCGMAQGYFFHKPLSEDKMTDLLSQSGPVVPMDAPQVARGSART